MPKGVQVGRFEDGLCVRRASQGVAWRYLVMITMLIAQQMAVGRGAGTSSCGPANAAAQGLVCAWEKPPSQAQYAAIEREKSDTERTTRSGFPFNTPAQCCCQRVDLAAAASGSGLQTRAAGSALATGSEKGDSIGSGRATWNGTRCFPHAIIVGAQKGGTTALFTHFLMRPDFEAPRAKEVSRGPTPARAGPAPRVAKSTLNSQPLIPVPVVSSMTSYLLLTYRRAVPAAGQNEGPG
jgi:hypothetical protein